MASDSAATSRRLWSKLEDERLISLVHRFGDKQGKDGNWTEISKHLPGRSNKDCRKRWFHSLDPALRKGRWSKEEDELLLAAHQRLGPAWKDIALLIEGRKDDQCAKRYNDILDPSAKDRLKNWSPEEDQYLAAKVQELGHKWAAISARLPGRPPLTCRNRWRRLSKDLLRVSEQTPGEIRSPIRPATIPRSKSISFPTNVPYSMNSDLLRDNQEFPISAADMSLCPPDNPLLSPMYGVDDMSIHSAPVYGLDNISIHSTQTSNGPGISLPDFSFPSNPYHDPSYESAPEGPSFALPDRNYESEPNMLTDVYQPRSISHQNFMHGHRYPWVPHPSNTLNNIASLDLANTQVQAHHLPFDNSSIIPEVDEEPESVMEQAAVRQALSSQDQSLSTGDLLSEANRSGSVQQYHHHFHHHYYHHHYHHH
ncbi:hypothetical protein N7478_000425 [Penicillium angulare]|uniref:uncharacterized protein n=1 Tax=Penicillium angulare TaxID=116970 RepID=UPI002540EEE9|nr:uncharacterized protein N7478_000425 [Penicillium angulare]KAJ5291174.1 hypothetical protein N7478_000425 [Penicillium angulare]